MENQRTLFYWWCVQSHFGHSSYAWQNRSDRQRDHCHRQITSVLFITQPGTPSTLSLSIDGTHPVRSRPPQEGLAFANPLLGGCRSGGSTRIRQLKTDSVLVTNQFWGNYRLSIRWSSFTGCSNRVSSRLKNLKFWLHFKNSFTVHLFLMF